MPAPPTEVRILTSACLAANIPVADVVEMVESGYAAAAAGELDEVPRRQFQSSRTSTVLHVLPGLRGDNGTAGVFVYTGGNRGKGRQLPNKVVLLFRTDDGGLEAIIEANWLSWARTGASAAVATRHLARADAATLGIFGSGRQARAQAAAVSAVRRFDNVLCYSRDAANRAAFAAELREVYGLPAKAVDHPDAVLESADVISTATNSRAPVFDGRHLRPGTHLNAIGQHYPDRREIDAHVMTRATLFADDIARSRQEDGEIAIPLATGEASDLPIAGTIGDVVLGTCEGRVDDQQVTVFLSGGTAGEYLSVAGAVAARARELDLGTLVELPVEWQPGAG